MRFQSTGSLQVVGIVPFESLVKPLSFVSHLHCIHPITAAVTGPPQKNYDFKTGVIGGSRSPHCSLRLRSPRPYRATLDLPVQLSSLWASQLNDSKYTRRPLIPLDSRAISEDQSRNPAQKVTATFRGHRAIVREAFVAALQLVMDHRHK